eukprot:4443546-Pyramimonas_sp.AAC.1
MLSLSSLRGALLGLPRALLGLPMATLLSVMKPPRAVQGPSWAALELHCAVWRPWALELPRVRFGLAFG